jgi:hypothetical protein
LLYAGPENSTMHNSHTGFAPRFVSVAVAATVLALGAPSLAQASADLDSGSSTTQLPAT